MNTRKVLFCGLGSIGQRHLRNLRALYGDSVEVIAYRGRNASPVLNPDMTVRPGAVLETTYNLTSVDRLDDALALKPDAAFITNPNSLHLPTALAAAEAGCHLFIEKPVSHSMAGMADLVRVFEAKRLTTFVAYQFRFHPGLATIKRLIDQGRLGQIISAHIVNGEHLPDWHPYEDYRTTHPARAYLGGGSLSIQTHELDYALWFFGLPRRAFALGGHLSRLEVDVEDSVDVLLECDWQGKTLPVHIHLDYVQRPPQRVCEVIGDAGKVRYDYYAGEVIFDDLVTRNQEVFRFPQFDRNQMFLGELRHFFACIEGREPSQIDLAEGIRSMRIGIAAKESLRTGLPVSV